MAKKKSAAKKAASATKARAKSRRTTVKAAKAKVAAARAEYQKLQGQLRAGKPATPANPVEFPVPIVYKVAGKPVETPVVFKNCKIKKTAKRGGYSIHCTGQTAGKAKVDAAQSKAAENAAEAKKAVSGPTSFKHFAENYGKYGPGGSTQPEAAERHITAMDGLLGLGRGKRRRKRR